jgi:hypothetical protein
MRTIFIAASLHGGDNTHAPVTAGARGALYYDFNVTAQQREELHEPFSGKPGKLPAQQSRNLGLVNLQNACCTSLGEPPGANHSGNAKSKSGLGKTLF